MHLTALCSELDLSRNQLRALPPDLSALSELRSLDVSSNHFRWEACNYFRALDTS